MASLLRVKLRWTGFSGAPGYSVFHFRDFASAEPTNAEADAAALRVETFAAGIASLVPSTVSMQAMSDVEVIDETNGQLITVHSVTTDAARVGTANATATYAAAVGAVVTWRTGGVRNGRRIRGRTFLVPLAGTAFATDGTLAAASITTLTTAATGLTDQTGAPDLHVWARPTLPLATDGISYVVTGFSIPDMGAVLRSRRN